MAQTKPNISAAELDVLKVLWQRGPARVRRVWEVLRDNGRKWAYATVLTLLRRLEAKGYVTSDRSELAYEYRPAVSRDQLVSERLGDLAAQIYDGMTVPLVLALVKERPPRPDEIREVRRLLDELEAKQGKEKTREKRANS